MFKVMVIKGGRFNTVHIFDPNGREAVFPQKDLGQLIMILRKARQAKGIPRDELDERGQFKKQEGGE